MKQLVYINNKINNAAIRRIRNERGDLVYVVPSYTLPDDVVMNGMLYPAAEIEKSYRSLENTPAPAGHPYDAEGNYISASSPDGVLYFQCGIFNKNVQRVECEKYGNRVYVEKHIHYETAMKTERGKRIIEAIDAGEPIHTSTGIILEPVDDMGVNASGKEYTKKATNMLFDHDAILLDEAGAATPEDGVGLLVNQVLLTQVQRESGTMVVNSLQASTSQESKENGLFAKMIDKFTEFLANHGEDFNRSKATQHNQEGENMAYKERVEAALKTAEIDFSEMTDEQKMNAFEKLLEDNAAEKATNEKGEQEQPKGDVALNADIQKLVDDAVKTAVANAQAATEAVKRTELGEQLKANGVELDAEDVAKMSVNSLQKMVEKTAPAKPAYNFGAGAITNNSDSRFGDELPE